MSEHTPGPWQAAELKADGVIIKKSGCYEIRTPFYDVATYIPNCAPIRNIHDAELIARAPDLLAENRRISEELRKAQKTSVEVLRLAEQRLELLKSEESENRRLREALEDVIEESSDVLHAIEIAKAALGEQE